MKQYKKTHRKCRHSKNGICTNDSVNCTNCNGSESQ